MLSNMFYCAYTQTRETKDTNVTSQDLTCLVPPKYLIHLTADQKEAAR